jgi:hypothetical protein
VKFTLRAIVTTVLTVAALAFATVPAQAVTIERIAGTLEPCAWTFFNTVREQRTFGAIYFDPSLKDTRQGYYMALINDSTGDVFTRTTYWGPGDYSLKLIASAVLAGTRFRIAMDKDRCGEAGRDFAGYLHYNK